MKSQHVGKRQTPTITQNQQIIAGTKNTERAQTHTMDLDRRWISVLWAYYYFGTTGDHWNSYVIIGGRAHR